MQDPLISLTTDFGAGSPYVAAMKGVILGINPAARLVDLSHDVPAQDVPHAAYLLAAAVPYFPASVLHVAVVDPGVGSARAVLYVEVDGHRLLVPDNGCWTLLVREGSPPPLVYRVSEPRFWRQPVSATFHGRDIFAPVAAHLSLGLAPQALGPPAAEWVVLPQRPPRIEADRLAGEVEFMDHFGNLITNIPGPDFTALAGRPVRIQVAGQDVPRRVRTYADAEPGSLVALVSSSGRLEIAVAQGSAARQLQARVGTEVTVTAQDTGTDGL